MGRLQPAAAPAGNPTATAAMARVSARRRIPQLLSLTAYGALLMPVTSTGIEKTAPWQVLSEAFVIETAFASVKVAVAPAATSSVWPVWSVNVTPVEALHAAPLSDVIVPAACLVTDVIRTGKLLPFVTLSLTEPVAPGKRSAVVDALASPIVRVVAEPALA